MSRDLYQEADALERAGRLDEAGERWREAVNVTPDAFTLARLGRFYLRQGNTQEGERLLREAIARFPERPGAYFYLGTFHKNQGNLAEAKALLQKSVDLEEWAPALIALGVVQSRLQETDAARRTLERATTVDPNDSEAWSNLAATYLEDDSDHARELFEKAVSLDHENAFAARELGYLLWRRGELHAAEAHLRQAVALVDHDGWSHEYLAIVLQAAARHEEAEREFRRATELNPDLPLFHCYLGDALIQLGRQAEGETEYMRALALDVSHFVANLRMGQRRSEQRRYAESRRYLERALALNPSDHRVQEALSSLPPE